MLVEFEVAMVVVGCIVLVLVMDWFGVCIMVDGVGGGCDGDG